MKNILLLSSLYPADDLKILNDTAVCHYFAKEWMKLGYNVRVIHTYHVYPFYYYYVIRLFRRVLANLTGIAVLDKKISKVCTYEKDEIKVTRIPIKKSRPGGSFSKNNIKIVSNKIREILDVESFEPNLILGHFLHPSLEIIVDLKEYFNVKTAVSLHGKVSKYNKKTAELLDKIDYIGYRSYPIGNAFERIYGKKQYFICPSGVPEEYLLSAAKVFDSPIKNFIYVGSLIKRKYPVCLLPAIADSYPNNDFFITYVGEGREEKSIRDTANELGIIYNIRFAGRLPRKDVTRELDAADVFIMISKNETFGLVYLEAMARGCIVIASKNEGMDGIIKNQINGFLCEAGNHIELASIIQKIKRMSSSELIRISQEAVKTANKYTDFNVAKQYIDCLIYS